METCLILYRNTILPVYFCAIIVMFRYVGMSYEYSFMPFNYSKTIQENAVLLDRPQAEASTGSLSPALQGFVPAVVVEGTD